MLGKQKCKILKEIRQRIADENDIPYVTRECTHKGECKGTCPKCEAELRYLEEQLQKRQSLGKRVAVAALCTGLAFSSAGCTSPAEVLEELLYPVKSGVEDLAGLIADDPGREYQLAGEVEVTKGEVAEGDWELEGDVLYEPTPTPASEGGGN